ncbi:hypothetical protein [Frankia sp. AgB32]|uniref:hypothetical protein n=1 Tax=Frankia sp. AgB32 TaxID=631119 RepID=UPI00200D9749|nr:hypothetical protein [Frankia sp. AgB32]MCK9893317.1 hypothetical protein [Frankia sp. AgB32]
MTRAASARRAGWRGAGAGAAFAVPAVALALLAHLPFAGRLPPAPWLLGVALAAVVLAAAADGLRAALVTRRGGRTPAWGVGGPRSFAGLLATQGLLHGALAAQGAVAGRRQAASGDGARLDALVNALLCHSRPARLPGGLDPALVAAARRAVTRTAPGSGSGGRTAGAHGALGGFAVVLPSGPASSTVAVAVAMPLAHAVAAALTFWWTRRGASLLAGAVRLLAARRRRHPARPPTRAVAPPARPGRHEPAAARLRLTMLRHAVARRGPPGAGPGTTRHQAAARQLAVARLSITTSSLLDHAW